MPMTIRRVVCTMCAVALLSRLCAAEFAVSQNPIPRAALQLTYKTTSNMWEFVDSFAMPYDRMRVLLCVAKNSSACDLTEESWSGLCSEIASHPTLASTAWRDIHETPDACLGRPVVLAAMHSEPPNKLFVNNTFPALQPFDTNAGMRTTENNGTIVLRVRFVYMKRIGEGAVHVISNGYELVMVPLQDSTHPLLVQSECSARGFRAPGMQLPPSLGGAVLQVEIINTSGIVERVCTWQCEIPYVKMPWNADAFTATSYTAASCVTTPDSFAAVALSFVIQYPAILNMNFNSKQMLLGLDQLAVKMADAMRLRFGRVRVLLSMRGSTINRRQVGEILTWVRETNTIDAYEAAITENPSFGLRPVLRPQRRLLAEDENATDSRDPDEFVVDAVIFAEQSEEANCCLVEGSIAAQQQQDATEFDFGIPVTSFDTPQVETTALVSRRSNPGNPSTPVAPSTIERDLAAADLAIWVIPVILLLCLFLILVCLFQTDGLYSNNKDDTDEKDEQGV